MNIQCTKKEVSSNLTDAKVQSRASPRVPPKKRSKKRKMKHRMMRHQGSSSLEPVHRETYKNYGHIKRVNFAIFLKILMHRLALSNKKLHGQAQEMILNTIQEQRAGKLQDTPLMSALRGRLYGLLGRDALEESERYLQTYLQLNNIRTEL